MKFINYGTAYLLWLINLLFGLWLVFISRNTWLSAFNRWYILESPTRAQRADFLDKLFILILGFSWLIMMVASEAYFRKGVKNNQLFPRFAKVSGPTILLVFVADAILALIEGLAIIGWLRLIVLLIELVLGLLLVKFGWKKIIPIKRGSE